MSPEINLEILQPQVAGIFYPASRENLLELLNNFFENCQLDKKNFNKNPKAIIAPHGGYLFSGSIAAEAFSILKENKKIDQVILLAPAHQLAFMGIATHQANFFSTPLGEIKLNKNLIERAFNIPEVSYLDLAFLNEHTVEVILPFLQFTLGENFTLAPFIIGQCLTQGVLDLLNNLILNPEESEKTLIVVSSDLSHYQPYSIAKELDQLTQEQITRLQWDGLTQDDACGDVALKALLQLADQENWRGECKVLKNSGDTVGEKDKVVGYGAFNFF